MESNAYIILGCATSGRRKVLYDLISDVAVEDNLFTILRESGETLNKWDEKIAGLPHVTIETYESDVASIATDQLNPHQQNIILSPGRENPVDQLEALMPLLESSGCGLSRIITVMHCDLLETHKHMQNWYDACIHFSDACLINRGSETTNQFLQDLADRYQTNHIPCLFVSTKKGRVSNPNLILEPQARRISHYFDLNDDWFEEEDEEDEDWEGPQEDPYMVKLVSGNREKWLPDICKMLDQE
jgi:hypothetical protein